MKFIILKPTSPSKRHYLNIYNKFNRSFILKMKIKKRKKLNGRNNTGKIMVGHKGSINKKLYRIISFNNKNSLIGITFNIEYDPNRNSNIGSIYNIITKSFFYIIAPKGLKPGHIIKVGENIEQKIGNCMILDQISIGCPIYNISFNSNKISKISRSAGTYSLLINKNKLFCYVKLSSGTIIYLSNKSIGIIGIVSNEFSFLKQLGKAGRSRWLNMKPNVRGVSMNPVDHPNGGGEGKKSPKRKNPWGKK